MKENTEDKDSFEVCFSQLKTQLLGSIENNIYTVLITWYLKKSSFKIKAILQNAMMVL